MSPERYYAPRITAILRGFLFKLLLKACNSPLSSEICTMVRSLSLTCCLALGVTAHAFAQQLDVAAIDRVFEAYTRPNTPGCVLGIGRGSQVLYERGYGMANLEYDAPLTASTIVEIGSVSKQFTAGAVLLLAQRGVLSLEDDIRKWLPEVPDFGKKITIRMLA